MDVTIEKVASQMTPKWVLDVTSNPPLKSKATNFADPPGYQTSGGKVGARLLNTFCDIVLISNRKATDRNKQ